MVTVRRGASKLGCLMSLLLTVTVAYFAVDVGEVYVRYFRFRDAIQQEARFSGQRTDDAIARRLAAAADSLGLPEDAGHVAIRHSGTRVVISADYTERVAIPFFARDIRFTPSSDKDE